MLYPFKEVNLQGGLFIPFVLSLSDCDLHSRLV